VRICSISVHRFSTSVKTICLKIKPIHIAETIVVCQPHSRKTACLLCRPPRACGTSTSARELQALSQARLDRILGSDLSATNSCPHLAIRLCTSVCTTSHHNVRIARRHVIGVPAEAARRPFTDVQFAAVTPYELQGYRCLLLQYLASAISHLTSLARWPKIHGVHERCSRYVSVLRLGVQDRFSCSCSVIARGASTTLPP
jgi:hypothetical protein